MTQGDYSGTHFSISSVGGRCYAGDGDVVVDRGIFTAAGAVRQFHATFRNMCGSGMRPAYGEIGIGVPLPRTVPVAPPPGKATMEVSGAEDAPIVRGNSHRFVNLVNAELDVAVGTAARVVANVSSSDPWRLELTPPAGRPLAPGRYDGAVSLFDAKRTGAPGLELSGNHSVCQEVRGSYEIQELVLAPNGFLQRFHATFVMYCGTHSAPARGTVTAEMPAWVSGYATPEAAALVLASARLRPAVPAPGRTYTVTVPATEFVNVACSATLAGRRLPGRIRRVGGNSTWTWQIPRAARGAELRLRIAATASGQTRVRVIARTVH